MCHSTGEKSASSCSFSFTIKACAFHNTVSDELYRASKIHSGVLKNTTASSLTAVLTCFCSLCLAGEDHDLWPPEAPRSPCHPEPWAQRALLKRRSWSYTLQTKTWKTRRHHYLRLRPSNTVKYSTSCAHLLFLWRQALRTRQLPLCF